MCAIRRAASSDTKGPIGVKQQMRHNDLLLPFGYLVDLIPIGAVISDHGNYS